jgi:hypothetical protein
MSAQFQITDLHGQTARDELLRVSNASAKETSLLSPERFDQLIDWASVALVIPPAAAFLLAFEQSDNYDGGHFLWFRNRFENSSTSIAWWSPKTIAGMVSAAGRTVRRSSAPQNSATSPSSAR